MRPGSNSSKDLPLAAACMAGPDRMRGFESPAQIIEARRIEDVAGALCRVERAALAGKRAVGYVAYEAAPAFDPALVTHPAGDLPLVWFAVFDRERRPGPVRDCGGAADDLRWDAAVDERAYRTSVARIREWIAAGDTYQVNYTFPMTAVFRGDPWSYFESICAAQPTAYGAFLDTGRFAILSVSPELFFSLDDDRIVTRPMKGTAARGLWSEDDRCRAQGLHASPKERAENVMIVDMVRNDLGRIAHTGTVRVASLFDTERHPTVWQMTSTVEARTGASLPEIFRALFPSASVTGAPKVRTMQIIRELEPAPRGVYCGAIGWVGPGRRAQFGVGIRTVTIDRASGTASYHVGSGVTWDSAAGAEYEECRLKAEVLKFRRPKFDLLESLKWDGEFPFLDQHIARLRGSAAYFGFRFDETAIRASLDACARRCAGRAKVRLIVRRDGTAAAQALPLPAGTSLRVALAPDPVDASNVYLYHKTTHREVYDRARTLRPECDDVLLWNQRGELTEATTANVVLRLGNTWYTPPVEAGLLPGVMRAAMLREGSLCEARLTIADLDRADAIALINSVRGWMTAALVEPSFRPAATA